MSRPNYHRFSLLTSETTTLIIYTSDYSFVIVFAGIHRLLLCLKTYEIPPQRNGVYVLTSAEGLRGRASVLADFRGDSRAVEGIDKDALDNLRGAQIEFGAAMLRVGMSLIFFLDVKIWLVVEYSHVGRRYFSVQKFMLAAGKR